MAQSRSKLIENVVKASFHQGDTSIFGQNSVGHQCVANCVIAGLYNFIILVSKWTCHNLDNILLCGDKLYKSISKTNSLLQVHDIGPQITAFENTYDFHIGHEFFGRIRKDKADNNIGSTLEKSTFSVIQENKANQFFYVFYVLAMRRVALHHCYLFPKNIVTSLIHTVEIHVACQWMVEHLY